MGELNLADNRLAEVPAELASLPALASLVLDGNPVASSLPSTTLRQFTHPRPSAGQSEAQALKDLLAQGGSRSATTVEPFCDGGDSRDEVAVPRDTKLSRGGSAFAGGSASRIFDDEDVQPWRKEQKAMLQEMERLQARVQELETE